MSFLLRLITYQRASLHKLALQAHMERNLALVTSKFSTLYVRSADYNEGRSERPGGFNDQRRNDRFNDRGDNSYRPRQNNSFYDDQHLNPVDWSRVDLSPIVKNFFKPSESVLSRPKADIDSFHRKHDIKVRGKYENHMVFEFNECGFPSYITDQLTQRDFKQPTVIQSMSWPTVLAGRDLVGIAQTGSGNYIQYRQSGSTL